MIKFLSIALSFLIFSTSMFVQAAPELPKGLKWITNDSDPEFASPKAKKGGTLRMFISTFPLTVRTVGPDSNNSFRGYQTGLRFSVTDLHPNTKKFIPALATHWAFGKDKKTVYYKLRRGVKWSDGKSLKATDFSYTLEFHLSKEINAPWYNNYYKENFEKVVVYGDDVIAVVSKKEYYNEWDKLYHISMGPTPRHFYGKLDKNFTKKYNWKVRPVVGPYLISKVKKGKSITLKRVPWWGENTKYFRNRYNVDRMVFKVIRDRNVAFEQFKKGKMDLFARSYVNTDIWHKKLDTPNYHSGYIEKYHVYNESPIGPFGLWLNEDDELMKDVNVRKGLAHSLNIQKIIDTILRGDVERSNSFTSGLGEYDNRKIKSRRFNLKKADEYFTKAGWGKRGKDGIRVNGKKRLVVKITTGYKTHEDRLVILKEEAKKAGVELLIQALDGAAAWKLVQEKKHQAHWVAFASGTLKPRYWQNFHSDNAHKTQTNNLTNTDNAKLDKLIMDYRNTFDDEKKKIRLAHEIQQVVHEISSFIPIYQTSYFRFTSWRWLKWPKDIGTRLSTEAEDHGLFWIDKDVKSETLAAMKKRKKFKPVTVINTKYKAK